MILFAALIFPLPCCVVLCIGPQPCNLFYVKLDWMYILYPFSCMWRINMGYFGAVLYQLYMMAAVERG